jgi:hypothetical protein
MKIALLLLAGLILRDLWCLGAAKIFCWRKRRQTQRHAQMELLRLRKESDERAARLRQQSSQRYGDKLPEYPFVIELETPHQFILTSREIVCMLRAQDKRRFLASESAGADN